MSCRRIVSPRTRTHTRTVLTLTAMALAAYGCSSTTSSSTNAPPPTAQSNDVDIVTGASTKTSNAFSPNPKTLALGSNTSVQARFVNQDISGGDYTQGTAVVHRIVSDNGSAATFDTGDLGGNATGSVTLSSTGTFTFHCTHHPNMVGSIQVTP